MRSRLGIFLLGNVALFLFSAHAQQPAGKGPPINPATAKLDVTITGLDGPGFAIATDGETLVVGCELGTLQVFKKDTIAAFKGGVGKPEVWKGHHGPVRAVAWTGGPILASVGTGKKINFWKMPEGKVAHTSPLDFRVRTAVMSNDGKTLASAGESDVIQLWDVAAGKPTAKLTGKMDWIFALAFSTDGKQLLSCDYDGLVSLWDVAAAKKIKDVRTKPMAATKGPPDPGPVTCVAFGLDGKTALLGMEEGPIQLVNLADGKLIRTFTGHTGPITGLALHPSGTLLASCSKDRTVKLWNPAGPQPALQALKSLDGHGAWIEGIVFLKQGAELATVSADHTVRIWDLAEMPKKK